MTIIIIRVIVIRNWVIVTMTTIVIIVTIVIIIPAKPRACKRAARRARLGAAQLATQSWIAKDTIAYYIIACHITSYHSVLSDCAITPPLVPFRSPVARHVVKNWLGPAPLASSEVLKRVSMHVKYSTTMRNSEEMYDSYALPCASVHSTHIY